MLYICSVINSELSYLGLNWNNTTLIHRGKIYSAKVETDKHSSAYIRAYQWISSFDTVDGSILGLLTVDVC